MKRAKSYNDAVRINMNVPRELLEKITDIGKMKGLNRTQIILMSISNYIDQRETFEYMPKIIELVRKEEERELKEKTKHS